MDRFSLNFKDKVCFITGASSGIGRATALAFARNGAKVVCVDLNEVKGIETCDQIKKARGETLFVRCDVSRAKDVEAAVQEAIRAYGRIDVAFNNAGIEGVSATTVESTEENWDRVIDVNLKGVWLCMKHQIPQMLKQGGGAIVNCSSIAGLVGFQNTSAYVASKHGVVGLTEAAALEYAKAKIRVNAVCPGVIQTEMIDRFVKGNEQALLDLCAGEPLGRLGEPDEIASAVLWLSSDGASFVTGQSIAVDGGWIAQ